MTKRTRRRWIILGVIIVSLVGGYLIACAWVGRMIDHRLREMVRANLDAELRLGAVRYHFPYGVTVMDASLVVKEETTSSGAPGESGGRGGSEIANPKSQIADPHPNSPPEYRSREQEEVAHIGRLELRLGELPRRDRPLVVEKLILTDPSVHLVQTQQGLFGIRGFFRGTHQERRKRLSDLFRLRRFALTGGEIVYEDQTRPDCPPMVWTGLRLDLSTMSQSDAVYGYDLHVDDLPTAKLDAKGAFNIDDLTLAVKALGLTVEAAPDGPESKLPSVLQEIVRANAIKGKLVISGEATVPLLETAAARFDLLLDLPGVTARVPQWNAALDRMALKLRCRSEAFGRDMASSEPSTQIMVASTMPTATPATQPGQKTPPIHVAIQLLDAACGDTSLRIEKGAALVDPVSQTWRVHHLLGTLTIGRNYNSLPTEVQKLLEHLGCRGKLEFTVAANGPLKPPAGTRPADSIQYELVAFPRDFSMKPTKFPLAIEKITGTIYVVPGLVRLQNMEGIYGRDKLFLMSARMPLAEIRREIQINEISGSIDFGTEGVKGGLGVRALDAVTDTGGKPPVSAMVVYPPPLDRILDALRPGGMYTLGGSFVIRPKQPHGLDYKLDIASDRASLTPAPLRLPLRDVHCDVIAIGSGLDGSVRISNFDANLFDGKLVATGRLKRGKPLTYEGHLKITGADVRQLGESLAAQGRKPTRLSGQGYLDAQVSGTGPTEGRSVTDNFRANGEFEIIEGEFWEVPVLKDILGLVKVSRQAATIGQAAGTFEIQDQVVELTEAAVSAPVLGLEGSGKVWFDGRLDLRVIAVPLADWEDKLKRTGIPIVSDALGAVAGGIQKALNEATSKLLYEFHVTGTIGKPEIATVPAPIVSKAGAAIFGKMLSPPKDAHLLDALRKK